jgi:hypothetical protein
MILNDFNPWANLQEIGEYQQQAHRIPSPKHSSKVIH